MRNASVLFILLGIQEASESSVPDCPGHSHPGGRKEKRMKKAHVRLPCLAKKKKKKPLANHSLSFSDKER